MHAPLSATGTACALVLMLLSSPLTLSAPSIFPGRAYLPSFHCANCATGCHPNRRWPLQCQQDKCNAAKMCVYLGSVCVLCAGCECCVCACCVCVGLSPPSEHGPCSTFSSCDSHCDCWTGSRHCGYPSMCVAQEEKEDHCPCGRVPRPR